MDTGREVLLTENWEKHAQDGQTAKAKAETHT